MKRNGNISKECEREVEGSRNRDFSSGEEYKTWLISRFDIAFENK